MKDGEFLLKFSIIIPAYNPGEELYRLLDQLLQIAKVTNTEIIVADDGSTNLDADKAKKYEDQGICFQYLAHGGVSTVRNCGIEISCGDYCIFFDSDDMVNVDSLLNVMKNIESFTDRPDIYMCGYSKVSEKESQDVLPSLTTGMYGKEVLSQLERSLVDVGFAKKYPASYFDGKVFHYFVRRSLFEKGLNFPDGQAYAEDLCYCMKMFDMAESIYISHDVIYRYYLQEGSASHRYRPYFWEEWNMVHKYISSYIHEDVWQNRYLYWCAKICIRHILKYENDLDKLKLKIVEILETEALQNAILCLNFSDWTIKERIENKLIKERNANALIRFELFVNRIKTIVGK